MGTIKYNVPNLCSILITAEDGQITQLYFQGGSSTPENLKESACNQADSNVLNILTNQLDAYFAGELKSFTVPINPKGTPFRKQVWQALQTIPYGKTISYKQLAEKINHPKAVRAVGGANHNNPISLIIPCHRVIGASGKLVGYGGGLEVKEFLLRHEGPTHVH